MSRKPFVLSGEIAVRANRASIRKASSDISRAFGGSRGTTLGSSSVPGAAGSSVVAQTRNAAAVKRTTQAYKGLYTAQRQARRESSTYVRDIASLTGGMISLHKALMTLQAGFRGMRELETRLVAIRQITGGTITQTEALGRAAINLSKDLGVSQSALLSTSTELLQAGKSMEQVRSWLPTLALLGKNAQVGADGLNAIAKAMVVWQNIGGLSTDETSQMLEKAVSLSKTQFISVTELIDSSTILARVWKDAGGNLDTMLATLAAVKTASGRPGSEVARGISTITMRITNERAKSFLRSEGVEVFDKQGIFKGIIPVLSQISELADKLDTSSESGKKLLAILSGIRQQNIGSTLLGEFDQIEKNMQTVGKALFVLERDAEMGMDSWSTKTTQLAATYQNLFNTVGQSPLGAFGKDVIDVTKNLASMDATLVALGVTLAGVAIARSGILPGIAGIGGRLGSAGRQAGLRGVAGVAHQRIGMRGGYAIGAGAAFFGAASINPSTGGEAAVKAGLQGVGAAMLALSVTASPLAAAFAGITIAGIGVASSFEELRLKMLTRGNVGQRQEIGALAGNVGLLDKTTLASTRRHIEQLAIKDQKANEAPGFSTLVWAETKKMAGDILGGEDSGDATNQLRRVARETFSADASKSRPLLEKYKEEFLSSGMGMDSFDSFAGGILPMMEMLDDLTDDVAGRNSSSRYRQGIAQTLAERNRTTSP